MEPQTSSQRGEMEEREVDIYESVDNFVSGPQETQGQRSKRVRRPLRVVAPCLATLCLILTAVIIVQAVHYNSANNQLNYNLTLERNNKELQSEVNQLKRETAVKSCPSGWQRFGCSCYNRSTEKENWEESRKQCQKIGADLVVIDSKEEQEFLRGLGHEAEGAASWIGLKKIKGNWTWVDATPLTIAYWSNGQPTDRFISVVYQHKKGKWGNIASTSTYNWICEKK